MRNAALTWNGVSKRSGVTSAPLGGRALGAWPVHRLDRVNGQDHFLAPVLLGSGWALGEYRSIERSFDEIPDFLLSSVVFISRTVGPGTFELCGTGFFIADGLVATAAHVVVDARMADVVGSSSDPNGDVALGGSMWVFVLSSMAGEMVGLPVTRIVVASKHDDLAVLEVNMTPGNLGLVPAMPPACFTLSHDQPRVGSQCLAVGYPEMEVGDWLEAGHGGVRAEGPLALDVRVGIIEEVRSMGRDKVIAPFPHLMMRAFLPSGMSGGPVFDECGHVIGLVSSSSDSEPPYAIVSLIAPIIGFEVRDPGGSAELRTLRDLARQGIVATAGHDVVDIEWREDAAPKVWWSSRPRKAGRNERCPCGSGNKYKRCHGRDVSTMSQPVQWLRSHGLDAETSVEDGVVWAGLRSIANPTFVLPRYGQGPSAAEAIENAAWRFDLEQVGAPPPDD